MSRTYYHRRVEDGHGGGFAVQVVEDGTEDFFAFFLTEQEARDCIAAEIVRDAAPALLAALTTGVAMRSAQVRFVKDRSTKNLETAKQWEAAFDKAAHDAMAKATGALTQGGLL